MPRRSAWRALRAEPIGETAIGRDLFSLLPEEILLHIWQCTTPWRFARINKRFYALSKSTLWRAKWFMQPYQRWEVIFRAIQLPRLFTVPLFEQLVRLGAPLSRSLVQLLHARRDPSLCRSFQAPDEPHRPHTRLYKGWGKNVSYVSYVAVLQHSANLYGDDISYEPTEFDSYIFSMWLTSDREDDSLRDRVRHLFSTYNFLPLPLEMVASRSGLIIGESDYSHHFNHRNIVAFVLNPSPVREMVAAVKRDPTLAGAAVSNGLMMTEDELEAIVASMNCPTRRFTGRIEVNAGKAPPIDELKVNGIVWMCDTYIPRYIWSLCGTASGFEYHGSQLVEKIQDPPEEQTYNTLSYLHNQSALPFDLSLAVEKEIKPLLSGAVSARMIPMVERLERDFPHSPNVSALFVRCMFLKAERESIEELDKVKAMMGHHQVQEADVDWTCLRNGCRTTLPLRYALRWLEGFGLARYTEGLVEQLLLQPYRGIMLRELDRFFCETGTSGTLHNLLVVAVERQAFKSSQLPAQHWSVDQDGERLACNGSPPVRSLLCFNFAGGNAKPVNLCKCKGNRHFFPLPPLTPLNCNLPRQLMICKHRGGHRLAHGTRSPSIIETTRFGGGPRREKQLEDDDRHESMEMFCNLYGPLAEDDEPVAEVLVDLLGPQSYAADVLLSHAVVNGNASLVSSLLDVGVALTLEHFKVALQVGYALPVAMLDCVTSGAPFKLAFGVATDASVGSNARVPTLRLSQDQMTACLDLACEYDLEVAIKARDDGTATIKKLTSARDKPVPVIAATAAPSLASRVEEKCVAWQDRLYDINNAQLWRSHLLCLSYLEGQKNNVLETISGRSDIQSDASRTLREFIHRLHHFATRWHGKTNAHESAARSVAPLLKELRRADDASLVVDVSKLVYSGLRGVRATRSSRRAAFQQSPYSYKSTKFRGKFLTVDSTVVHEAQLEPLADEDSDEDFTRDESEAESSDSDSDVESLSSAISDASSESVSDDRLGHKRRRTDGSAVTPSSAAGPSSSASSTAAAPQVNAAQAEVEPEEEPTDSFHSKSLRNFGNCTITPANSDVSDDEGSDDE